MPSLFDPITLGAIEAPNRILMAPLTRTRATDDHVPTELMIDYYRQRAGAGVIISEATGISRQGLGWPNAPGIWTAEQVEAWKPITEAVHKADGRIVVQLWHMGRLARPDTTGLQSISSSPLRAPYANPDKNPYDTPRAATLDEIKPTLDDYAAPPPHALVARRQEQPRVGRRCDIAQGRLIAAQNRRQASSSRLLRPSEPALRPTGPRTAHIPRRGGPALRCKAASHRIVRPGADRRTQRRLAAA